MNGPRVLVLETASARLDRAVAAGLTEFSRTAIARWIAEGRVTVDGIIISRPSHPVSAGQTVVVDIPPPRPTTVEGEPIPLRICYEDEAIAVIDKPAGLVVHPAAGHEAGTMVNALLYHLDGLSGVGGEIRPGIVHRLDRDTSGVMVVAKTDAAHRALTESWGSPEVRKRYIAIVYGSPSPERGTIDAPIGRSQRNRKKMAVVEGGRESRTDYEVTERLRFLAVVRCILHTGRTHQIRVHLASIGHPVVGDPLYAGPQWRGIPDKRIQKAVREFSRQALHAESLSFHHPLTGEPVEFHAPLPADMEALINALRA